MFDHQPAEATRFPSHSSGRPGLELRTATKLSSAGFEPTAVLRPLVHESVAFTTRPRTLLTEISDRQLYDTCTDLYVPFLRTTCGQNASGIEELNFGMI